MDDVIFKGTIKRRPVGMAEVTLVFDNEDRGLPIDFSEVAIKRKVTRDGGSDYFLNGSLCRLKDLRDLFYDSGVNNTSYSIIEESMIKQILNENNNELRTLLEEGSGITKYKARRKETQRKLDRAQADLLRLYDIIEEIGREVRSLQRQVGKARRHQKLFKEIRALDLMVAGKRRSEMDSREAEARENLEQFRTHGRSRGRGIDRVAGQDRGRPPADRRARGRTPATGRGPAGFRRGVCRIPSARSWCWSIGSTSMNAGSPTTPTVARKPKGARRKSRARSSNSSALAGVHQGATADVGELAGRTQ